MYRSYALWINGRDANGGAGGYANISKWFKVKESKKVAKDLRV
jgi:hypothetical protein